MYRTSSSIRQKYELIDPNDHQERLLFFEQFRSQISQLNPKEYFALFDDYIESLHLCGKSDRLLREVDPVIEYALATQVDLYDYKKYISWKANAYYQTLRYAESQELSKQLIGMNPHEKRYHYQLHRAYRAERYALSVHIRITAIILIFMGAISSAIIAIYGTSFKPSLWQAVLMIIAPCSLAILALVSSFAYYHQQAWRETRSIIQSKILKKLSTKDSFSHISRDAQ